MKQLFRDVDSDDEMFIQLNKAAEESGSNLTPRMIDQLVQGCVAGREEGYSRQGQENHQLGKQLL